MTDVCVRADEMASGDRLFLADQYVYVAGTRGTSTNRLEVRVQTEGGQQLLLFYDRQEQVVVRRDGHVPPPPSAPPRRARRKRAPSEDPTREGGTP